VSLYKQIFLDVLWTIWLVLKICLGLVHAVNFNVEAVRVFVVVLPLLGQKLPLSSNKLSMFVHCNPCSSFRSSLENNILELGFRIQKNCSLSFGDAECNVRMPTYYFLQYIVLLLIKHIRAEHLWFSFQDGFEIRTSLTFLKSVILLYNCIGIFVFRPNSHKS